MLDSELKTEDRLITKDAGDGMDKSQLSGSVALLIRNVMCVNYTVAVQVGIKYLLFLGQYQMFLLF